MVLLGLPALPLAINSSIPTLVSFDDASLIPVSLPVFEVKIYPGNVIGRRGNVTICFLPDLLQIINEKISTPKKVVLFGLPPGICLTELL